MERVQRLRTAAVAADDENTIKRRTGELVDIAQSVESLIETIKRLGNGVAELRTTGVRMNTELAQKAPQVVAMLYALSDSLPNQAVDASLNEAKMQVKAAQGFVNNLRLSVEEAWKAKRSREVPAINDDLITALARSGIEVEEIRIEIERAQGTLAILNNRAIPELGDVERLTRALEILRSCGKRISELVDPTLAQIILNTQETTGMPLSSFTPEILAGLTRLGILDRFWVRLR
ncbi:hypothetical protein [Nonomuraea angiospora]|uniref:hypothetical protein n=1 Tax=Nonomuraea angiospora TaxID=46172 RepID=UPI0029BF2FDB|nr:hypothetical protein [Nonomuraea angiospora]MDX3106012.1 hypothetical protein [Nonomuraea angiospora]